MSTFQAPVNIQAGLLYPPIPMTSNSTVVSAQTYGNGTYVSSWSTADFGTGSTAWYSFTRSLTLSDGSNNYTGGNPSVYNGSTSTTDANTGTAYLGAYIQIQFPSAIQILYHSMCGAATVETRMPYTFYVFGSTNGTTWYLVDSRTAQSWSAPQVFNTYYPNGTSASTPFSYWRLVANSLQGNWSNFQICQWFLYGPQTPVGPAQYIVGGNVGVGLTNPTATLQVAGNIYYNEDVFNRGPHLLPTPSNAAVIQAWISATCNAASQAKSWWGMSPAPLYSNLASTTVTGGYGGSVLLPDGRVLFCPSSSANIGFFTPTTQTFSNVAPVGFSQVSGQFRSAVLAPNGNVIFIPWNTSNVGVFNPTTYAYANIAVGAVGGTYRFQGGVLGPTGNVIMIPRDSANIGVFNPTTLTMTNVGPIAGQGLSLFGSGVLLPNGNVVMSPLATGANIGMYNTYSLSASGFSNVGPIGTSGSSWESATLAPNGNVIFAPSSATNVVVYNPTFVSSPLTTGYSNVPINFGTVGSGNQFQGSALLPTGNVIFCPADSSNVGMFDPVALTYSNCARVDTATGKFFGAILIPDGRVVFTPAGAANVGVLNTMTPAPVEFCRVPYFNKY